MQTIVCGHANIFKPCKQLRVDTHTFSNCANNCLWTCKHFQTVQTSVCGHANIFKLCKQLFVNNVKICCWLMHPLGFPVDILKEQLAGFQRMQTIVLSPSCLLLSWCAWCFHRAACCLCFHPPPPTASAATAAAAGLCLWCAWCFHRAARG